jgi:hypothetical protein
MNAREESAKPSDGQARSNVWLIAGLVMSVVITALTWTALRPYLVITDGAPLATDPFTPLGVAIVNAILLGLGWLTLGVGWLAAQLLRSVRSA